MICRQQPACCSPECWQAISVIQLEGSPDAIWRNYSCIEQRQSPHSCVHCSSTDVKPIAEPELHENDGKMRLVEHWGCDSCGEPQFDEITVFVCPNSLEAEV